MIQLYAYNAGKGDCIRIRFADTHNIFIDTGVMGFAPTFKQICNDITSAGETLDVLILSHVDDDHIGGILGNLRTKTYRCPFAEVWMNHSGGASTSETPLSTRQNDEVYGRLKKQGVSIRLMLARDINEIADAIIETIWPEKAYLTEVSKQRVETPLARHSDYGYSLSTLAEKPITVQDKSLSNKNSIVFTFSYEGHKLLFTGDAWAEDVVKAEGDYDLIKLPHHGSVRNISEEYPASFHSQNFLICTDGVNHPDKQAIAKLEKWYGDINIYSPSAWWNNHYFTDDDKTHHIHYHQKEGLVIAW